MLFRSKKEKDLLESLEKNSGGQSYWSIVSRAFKKNKAALWSLRFLMLFVFVALFSDFLANEKPLYCKLEGQSYYPVLKDYAVALGWDQWEARFYSIDWKAQDYESVWWAPVTYSASTIDIRNSQFKGPFDKQDVPHPRHWHWLGTDEIGRDVAAGMISGTRTAMLVGLIAMSIASLIGIFLGTLAGYFGDKRLKMSRLGIGLHLIAVVLGVFYGFMSRSYVIATSENTFWQILIGVLILFFFLAIARGLTFFWDRRKFSKRISLPVDIFIMRLIEVVNSIPGLLWILAIIPLLEKPSVFNIMIIIGLLSWTGIARFIRAELLRVRELEFVEAAKAMGYSDWRIIVKHAIPNAISPVLVSIAFGIAAAILIEATLTFIGIGLSIDQVTWGSLLNEARKDFGAWWIALLPGVAIFFTVTIFNLIGDGLANALDPKLKQ